METHLQTLLEDLKLKVLHMAAYAERSMERAVRALLAGDSDLAEAVIEQDQEINRLECEIDELGLTILAREQPVARDLRFVMGAMRTIIDQERIGDEAVNVAEKTVFLTRLPAMPHNPLLEELANQAMDMLKFANTAFKQQDADMAGQVCRMDQRADDINIAILKKTMDDMVCETVGVRRAVNVILAARALERAADLATNVAETTIFIVKGVNIKHHCGHY